MPPHDALTAVSTTGDAGLHRLEVTTNLRVVLFGVAILSCIAALVRSAWVAGAAGALVGLIVPALVSGPPHRLRIRITGPPEVELGQTATFRVTVRNDSTGPSPRCVLHVEAAGLVPVRMEVDPLSPGQQHQTVLPMTAGRRGRSPLAMTLSSSDAFGLLRRVVDLPPTNAQTTAVLPVRVPPPDVERSVPVDGPPLPGRQADGAMGVRPWRRGDNRRDIHWRASARHSHLVVVERPAPPASTGVAILVAGAAGTVDDELVVAAAAAVAAHVSAAGGEVTCAAWTLTGRVTPGPYLFAERATVLPRIPDVLAALPAGCPVAVAAAADASPAWRHELEGALAARGQTVHWLEPAVVDPAVRDVIGAGLPAPVLAGAA